MSELVKQVKQVKQLNESNIWAIYYSQPLSIVTPFRHNANSEKMVIIDRCDYRQRKVLMFHYETGTDDTGRRCDYRQSFHMV